MLILFHETMWGILDAGPAPPGVEITTDRRRFAEADVVVFHLPEWPLAHRAVPWLWWIGGRLAPRKRPGQKWVAWTMECDENYPLQSNHGFLRQFDYSMTYRLDSDVPVPYALNRRDYGDARATIDALLRPPPAKIESPLAAAFVSSRIDRSNRRRYLRELARHLAIDSYGTFLRNKALAEDRGPKTKLDTIARYKFTLAFENARGVDYVTEKFYDPLIAGSVPVYLGASNAATFAPGDGCYIDAAGFPDPRELAEHLTAVAGDEERYQSYFAWKQRPLRAEYLRILSMSEIPIAQRLCTLLAGKAR